VTTAVDTNVLLDVFGGDPVYGPASAAALRSSLVKGKLIACEVVWAEVIGFFPSVDACTEAMERIGIEFSALGQESAIFAGVVWREYRTRGGKRERMVADFLIGAHAARQADQLLSRDRGFYRSYFKKLRILSPGARL
jgi:predicted nucleic acid-binding protein